MKTGESCWHSVSGGRKPGGHPIGPRPDPPTAPHPARRYRPTATFDPRWY
ncbi:hypothetical protein KCP74_06290 [Salmonella enterica subsp. enterica]|nr:hypothetical protein KCP74_06290 [Salmonella enterica subsp. enterica]